MDVDVTKLEPASVAEQMGEGQAQELKINILTLTNDALIQRTELWLEKVSATGQSVNSLIPVLLNRLKNEVQESNQYMKEVGQRNWKVFQVEAERDGLVKSVDEQNKHVIKQAKMLEEEKHSKECVLKSKAETFELYQKQLRKTKRLQTTNKGLQTKVKNLTRKKK